MKNQSINSKFYNESYIYSSLSKKYPVKISYGQNSIICEQYQS